MKVEITHSGVISTHTGTLVVVRDTHDQPIVLVYETVPGTYAYACVGDPDFDEVLRRHGIACEPRKIITTSYAEFGRWK